MTFRKLPLRRIEALGEALPDFRTPTDLGAWLQLIQKTFANHLRDQLGWEIVYAHNTETFGPHGMPGRASDLGAADIGQKTSNYDFGSLEKGRTIGYTRDEDIARGIKRPARN